MKDVPAPESASWGDFVTDDAVREVLAGACYERPTVAVEEIALSACDDDFAGHAMIPRPQDMAPRLFVPIEWPETAPAERPRLFAQTRVMAPNRSRAKPPTLPFWESVGAHAKARSGYRWWVPAMIGVAATFVLSAVLFVSTHEGQTATATFEIPHPVRAQYFEPKLENPLEADVRREQPPVAASEMSFPVR